VCVFNFFKRTVLINFKIKLNKNFSGVLQLRRISQLIIGILSRLA